MKITFWQAQFIGFLITSVIFNFVINDFRIVPYGIGFFGTALMFSLINKYTINKED